jgi:toxin ParE1/3/4
VPERKRFVLAAPARRDLAEIWAWIAENSGSNRADAVLTRLRDACTSLAGNALIGRERQDFRAGLRSFAVPPHVIFYEPTRSGVRVLRVIHGARHLPRALREPSPGNES